MFKVRKSDFFALLCIVCVMLHLKGCVAQMRRSHHGSQRRHNQNSQANGPENGLPIGLRERYLNAVDEQQSQQHLPTATEATHGPDRRRASWNRFTPSIPTPMDSDCFVNVCHTQRGRCTQLGGRGINRPYICQSGDQFEFQRECELIVFHRHYND